MVDSRYRPRTTDVQLQATEIRVSRITPEGSVRVDSDDRMTSPQPETTPGPLTGVVLGERYAVEGILASGTGGHVYIAFDRRLMRRVALKTLRERFTRSFEQRQRFLIEARRMSALDHPGVPAVSDIGMTDDSAPFFTMTLVRGTSLHNILSRLRTDPAECESWTLTRLLQVLQRIAETLDYAHHRGLIHRDVKPANIGVGDHGEVYVLDWGLAKRLDADPYAAGMYASMHSLAETERGAVKGTPLYMAPEQARGDLDSIDPRTDIFALGAILYEMLTLRPPYDATNLQDLLRIARLGQISPLEAANEERDIPPALQSLAMRALASDLDERPSTARDFAEEVQRHLDGARRHETSRRHIRTFLSNALRLVEKSRQHEQTARSLQLEATKASAHVGASTPMSEKRRLWAMEDRSEELSIEGARTLAHAMDLTSRAIAYDPINPDARELMGRLYLQRLRQAVARRDSAEAAWLERMVELYNDGPLDDAMCRVGCAIVASQPTGVQVTVSRQVQLDRRWIDDEPKLLGVTPLAADSLERGSATLQLHAEGYLPARCPLNVVGGMQADITVKMIKSDAVPDGLVHVPAGAFRSGAPGVEENVDLGDYLISRFPVTLEEYATWLAEMPTSEFEQHVPRARGHGPLLVRTSQGFEFTRQEADSSAPMAPNWKLPATGITLESAQSYADWWGTRHGCVADLPTEAEWEKAVRGTDGRSYSWGDAFEATYCATRESVESLQPIGAKEHDVSPYDVHDLSGGVAEWCRPAPGHPELAIARGGAWSRDQRAAQAHVRLRATPQTTSDAIGFRLAVAPPIEMLDDPENSYDRRISSVYDAIAESPPTSETAR